MVLAEPQALMAPRWLRTGNLQTVAICSALVSLVAGAVLFAGEPATLSSVSVRLSSELKVLRLEPGRHPQLAAAASADGYEDPACSQPATPSDPAPVIFILNAFNGTTRNTVPLLCGIESAARLSRSLRALVLVFSPPSDHAELRSALSSDVLAIDTFRICPLDIEGTLKGTPIEPWYEAEGYKNSSWPQVMVSDAVRLALLYKRGGFYIDADIVPLHPRLFTDDFGNLGTFLPLTPLVHYDPDRKADSARPAINNALLRFPRPQHPFLWEAMRDFVVNYDGFYWDLQGPHLVSRLAARCFVKQELYGSVGDGAKSRPIAEAPAYCDGLRPWHAEDHRDDSWRFIPALLHPPAEKVARQWAVVKANATYIHWIHSHWNKLHLPPAAFMHKGSMMEQLFAEQCPSLLQRHQSLLTDGDNTELWDWALKAASEDCNFCAKGAPFVPFYGTNLA